MKQVFFLSFLILIYSQSATISETGYCLGNCNGCKPDTPNVCASIFSTKFNANINCLQNYDGNTCEITTNNYFNLYAQNNTVNNFVGWASPANIPIRTCSIPNTNTTINSLGPFNSSINATKILTFTEPQGVKSIIVNLGVIVRQDQLKSLGKVSVKIQTINNTTIVTPNFTQSNVTSIPFLKLLATDIANNNAIFGQIPVQIKYISYGNTSCGKIYQFQFLLNSNNPLKQVVLTFITTPNSGISWFLTNFRIQVGCSGFSSFNKNTCSQCLSGYYGDQSKDGYFNGCKRCPIRCSTCDKNGVCLSCDKYAQFDDKGNCIFRNNYKVMSFGDGFTTKNKLITPSIQSFNYSIQSSNNSINLELNLKNNLPYFFKCSLLYPKNFASSNFTLQVNKEKTIQLQPVIDLTTLSRVNGGQEQLFILPVVVDLFFQNTSLTKVFSLNITSAVNSSAPFYLVDPILVQYQCGTNCGQCKFDLKQTVSCSVCSNFFSISSNCQQCANGFYKTDQGGNSRCVKCYSNCLQCRGPSNFQCLSCLPQFRLSNYIFDTPCIQNSLNQFNNRSSTQKCNNPKQITNIKANYDCLACLKQGINLYTSASCIACWSSLGYYWGRCTALPSSQLSFYATDASQSPNISSWKSTQNASPYTCSKDYANIFGILQSKNNNTNPITSTLTFPLIQLPKHTGLLFVLNVIKVDTWKISNITNPTITKIFPLNIIVQLISPGMTTKTWTIALNNSYGTDICGDNGNESIWTVQSYVGQHLSDSANITVIAPDQGIFVRQLQVYLGNCDECANLGLSFTVFALPNYTDVVMAQTGITAYVIFNNPVLFYNTSQNGDKFAQSFVFKLGQKLLQPQLIQNKLNSSKYLKYFLPVNYSFINQTLTTTTNAGDTVYTKTQGVSRQLLNSASSLIIQRHLYTTTDTRQSMNQIGNFLNFFAWFGIITTIIFAAFGISVVIQELLMILQIIFLHVYIGIWLLPPSVIVPLSKAYRLQHLNYFSDIVSTENNLFGPDQMIKSDFILSYFNKDIYFWRSMYPIIFINIILIVWFIILKVAYQFITCYRSSNNLLVKFLRGIPNKPLAYFDQLFRFQFLSVIWACILQFSNFQGNGLNQAGSVIALVIVLAWPLVVIVYTFEKHQIMSVDHFNYLYHDIYYLKTPSVVEQPKYYVYMLVRFIRLLCYAVFICSLIRQTIIGPVLLIFINLIQAALSFFIKIYKSDFYLVTRIIQNILLVVALIFILIIQGSVDRDTLLQTQFQNLGFGLCAIFVILIVNAIIRAAYLSYKKLYQWIRDQYDIGEQGELIAYDKSAPMVLPSSERRIV